MTTSNLYIRTDHVEAIPYTGEKDILQLLEFTSPSKQIQSKTMTDFPNHQVVLSVLGGELIVNPGDYVVRVMNTFTGIYNWYTADQTWFEQNHKLVDSETA